MTIKSNNVVITILCLVAIFVIFFAWYLQRTCRRVWDVEVHEMQYQKAMEAARKANGDTTAAGGTMDGNANVTGNAGGENAK
jgi:hypothetical protein